MIQQGSAGAIYTSTNTGETWTATSSPSAPPNRFWWPIASSSDGTMLVAGIAGGTGSIYRSTNSGLSWFPTAAPSKTWATVACSTNGSSLVAGAWNDAVYTSTDSGITWISNSVPKAKWLSVACAANGSRMFAAAQDGGIFSLGSSPLPQLSAQRSGTNMLLYWPSSAAGFRLVANPDLNTTNWSAVTNATTIVHEEVQVLLPDTSGRSFFRLISP